MRQFVKVRVLGLVERCLQGETSLEVTTVETPAPVEVTIVGIATFGTADGLGPTTFTAFTLEGRRSASNRTRWVSTSPTGAPLRYRNFMRRVWRPTLEDLELSYVGVHVLRILRLPRSSRAGRRLPP
jgi:hypothetical protein